MPVCDQAQQSAVLRRQKLRTGFERLELNQRGSLLGGIGRFDPDFWLGRAYFAPASHDGEREFFDILECRTDPRPSRGEPKPKCLHVSLDGPMNLTVPVQMRGYSCPRRSTGCSAKLA